MRIFRVCIVEKFLFCTVCLLTGCKLRVTIFHFNRESRFYTEDYIARPSVTNVIRVILIRLPFCL